MKQCRYLFIFNWYIYCVTYVNQWNGFNLDIIGNLKVETCIYVNDILIVNLSNFEISWI